MRINTSHRYRLEKKYFIGDALPHKWTSVYNYKPVSEDRFVDKGEVFAIISLYASSGFNAMTAGNLLIDCFHETYFESKKQQITGALSEAITAVQDRLSELLAKEEVVAKDGVDFNITAMVIRGDEVYFSTLGGNKIYLLPYTEATKLLDITASLRDPFGKGIIRIGSSYLRRDQRFLLMSERAAVDINDEEKIYALRSLNDLRFKNRDYSNPEEISMFLIGVGVDMSDRQPLAPTLQEKIAGNVPVEKIEVNDVEEQKSRTTQEFYETPRQLVGLENQEGHDNYGHQLPPDAQDFVSDFDTEDGDTGSKVEWQEKLRNIQSGAKLWVSKLRGKIEKYRRDREAKKLQSLREGAALQSEATGMYHPAHLPETRIDISQLSTIRGMFVGFTQRLREFKDIVLYDLLLVNQSGRYVIKRDSITFKALILLGIMIIILIIYTSISSIGRSREESRKRDDAYRSLEIIRQDIDKIEDSAVLNSKSFGDIAAREELLRSITRVEGKFSPSLDVLPEEDIKAEKDRLVNAKTKVLKIKNPNFSVLADIGNVFEGNIVDFVQIDRNLYILDAEKGRIYQQPVFGGDATIVIDGLKQPTSLAVDGNNELVVYESGAADVISIVNPATKEKRNVVGLSIGKLPKAKDMAVYTNTNGLYLVSTGLAEVFLSTRTGANYAIPTNRYSAAGLNDIQDIEIVDGRIVLLAKGIGIDRVGIDGASESVTAFDDVTKSIKTAEAMGQDSEWLYFADNDKKRLLILTKSRGNLFTSDFVSQVMLDKVEGEVLEIYVDRNKDLIFLATSRRIYALKWSEVQ